MKLEDCSCSHVKYTSALIRMSLALESLIQSISTYHPGLKTGQIGPKKPKIHSESLKQAWQLLHSHNWDREVCGDQGFSPVLFCHPIHSSLPTNVLHSQSSPLTSFSFWAAPTATLWLLLQDLFSYFSGITITWKACETQTAEPSSQTLWFSRSAGALASF